MKLYIFSFFFITFCSNALDFLIFSYDRPCNLYAFLESLYEHTTGYQNLYVIYRSSSSEFDSAYEECLDYFKAKFDNIVIWKEENPNDFKDYTHLFFSQSKANYICFGLDDIIITDKIDFLRCALSLDKYDKCFGFYLRLGKNINYCYTENIPTPVCGLVQVEDDIFTFNSFSNKGDWGYPFSVDLCVYRKDEIKLLLYNVEFRNPNTLEASLASKANRKNRSGLVFSTSKMINIPFNKVQDTHANRSMDIDKYYFLKKFQEGYKLDIDRYYHIQNTAPHVEQDPYFIKRYN